MRQSWIFGLLFLTLFASTRLIDSQTNTAAPYNLSVAVDEVSLTFHAAAINGLSIDDLKLSDLNLLDNGMPPRRILLFEARQNLPIRAGILMDTSASMEQNRPSDRAIAIQYAQKVLRQQTDQAFVMSFGKRTFLLQPWTNQPALLMAGVDRVGSSYSTTAIFDALYSACRYQFGETGRLGNGNFILLFPTEKTTRASSPSRRLSICASTPTQPSTSFAPKPRQVLQPADRETSPSSPAKPVAASSTTTAPKLKSAQISLQSSPSFATSTASSTTRPSSNTTAPFTASSCVPPIASTASPCAPATTHPPTRFPYSNPSNQNSGAFVSADIVSTPAIASNSMQIDLKLLRTECWVKGRSMAPQLATTLPC